MGLCPDISNLENLEHLSLIPCRETKKLYDELIKLPKLKYGLLITRPELYTKGDKSLK